MNAPHLIIVGGPNGCGKSTFATEHAKETGIRYVGADQIADQLDQDNPTSVKIEASRQFVSTIRQSIENRDSLVIESTLAGKSLRKTINDAKSVGYRVSIIFVFLDSEDMCIERVHQRVLLGGHDVPETDIRRRYSRAIVNFWSIYRLLADFWLLVYNSDLRPENVAFGTAQNTIIQNHHLFELFKLTADTND